jgi:N-acetylglucosamine-6-phosphate deacetylase
VQAADRTLSREPEVTTLACARVVNGEGGISATPAWVSLADGRIIASGVGAAPSGALDLGDALVAPGFLDVQVNGTGAVDFATASADEVVGALDDLALGGTTGVLLTICSAPLDAYDDGMLDRIATAQQARPDVILGVHLEGPFLGNAPGAHPPELLCPSDVSFLARLWESWPDLIRMVTLAPEADPDLRATRWLAEHGVVVALGHSDVDYDGALVAADAGATVVTHLFNGMGAMHHRAPGLAGAALTDRRLVPSLIADFVHVHPAMVKLALEARPDAVLVTDAVRADMTRLPDGTLAGSELTMDVAVRHAVEVGVPIGAAVRHATANPARVLGLIDRGRIAPGARADLVALDPDTLEVRAVWLAGKPFVQNGTL